MSSMLRRPLVAVSLVVGLGAATVGLAACGGSSGGGSSEKCPTAPGAIAATIQAGPNGAIAFDKKTLAVKGPKFVVQLTNGSTLPHTFQIHGWDGKANVDGSTKSACATFDITTPGTYTFYCGVSGHEAAGMKGTITVS